MKKRIFSTLLALVMVLSVMPHAAFADDCAHENITYTDGGDGTCTPICADCGEAQGESAPHAPKTIPGTPATCTATGLSDGEECENCGAVLKEQEKLPMATHDFQDNVCKDCGYKKEAAQCEKSTWIKGSETSLTVVSPADAADFKSVRVDGQKVEAANYTVESGSTKVTLKAEFLETLAEGEHTVRILSKGSEASAKFTVKVAALYDVWVNGTRVHAENAADVLGDGLCAYAPDTNTLTLSKESHVTSVKATGDETLKIVLSGTQNASLTVKAGKVELKGETKDPLFTGKVEILSEKNVTITNTMGPVFTWTDKEKAGSFVIGTAEKPAKNVTISGKSEDAVLSGADVTIHVKEDASILNQGTGKAMEDGKLSFTTAEDRKVCGYAAAADAEGTELVSGEAAPAAQKIATLQFHIHTGTQVPAKDAACTADGNSEYYTCTCGTWFADAACTEEIADHTSVVIPALGHKAAETWEKDGENHWKVCSACNEKLADTAAAHADADVNGACDTCGAEMEIPHTHDFKFLKKDDTNHWMECECGEKDEVAAHDFSTWKHIDDKHWQECTCGIQINEGTHEDKDTDGACDSCGIKMAIPHTHKYEGWKSDENTHWQECTCGEKANEGAHFDKNSDNACDTCAAKMEKPHTHDFKIMKSDSTNHWQECDCGEKNEAKAHEDKDQNGTCDVCGGKVEPPHTHSFSTEWFVNASGHWHRCECGARADEAAHVDTDSNGKCDFCGYSMPVAHVHSYSVRWSFNDTMHWRECSCGDKSGMAEHSFNGGGCEYCDYALSYKITTGDGGSWVRQTKKGYTAVSDAPFAKFQSVEVDGWTISSENYTAEESGTSTSVTLKTDYLEGLGIGTHTLRLVSKDGVAATTFVVKRHSPTAQTGDSSNLMAWIALVIAAAMVLTVTLLMTKKKAGKGKFMDRS